MKKVILFLSIAVCTAFAMACSSSNGPEAVATKAIAAIQKGDYDAYAATFNLSSSDQKMLAGMAEEKVSKQLELKGGIKSFKITDSAIDGENAKVTAHLVYKDGSEEDQVMSFKNVEGTWKQEMNK